MIVQVRQLDRAIDQGGVTTLLGPVFETAALAVPLVGVTLTMLLSVFGSGRRLGRRLRCARDVLDDEESEDPAVDTTTNDHIAASDARAFERTVHRPHERGPVRHGGEDWDAHFDLDARLDRARARIDEQAHALVEALSRTVETAQHELHLARSVRSKAEEEAEAIRAAAARDAADLLAHTRNGVQALLEDVCRQLDPTGEEARVDPGPEGPEALLGSTGVPPADLR